MPVTNINLTQLYTNTMKTKILLVILFAVIFGFATQAHAQTQTKDVIKFVNVESSNGQVRAQVYCTQTITLECGISSIFSAGSFSYSYTLGSQSAYRSTYGSQTITVTLYPGYNNFSGYISGSFTQYSYPQGYIYLSRILSGNAVLGSGAETYLHFSKNY